MNNQNIKDKLVQYIKSHPTVSIGSVIGIVIFSLVEGILDLDKIIQWLAKLKSLIEQYPIICMFTIVVVVTCFYRSFNYHIFIKYIEKILKNRPNIKRITIKRERGGHSLYISEEENEHIDNTQMDNITPFRSHNIENDTEGKQIK